MNHDLIGLVTNLSYRDLWQLCRADIELSRIAAEEIRARRRRGVLPLINDLRSAEYLNGRQKYLYGKLCRLITLEKLEIGITEAMVEGWTVFLTGSDERQIDGKLKKTRDMIRQDIEEFGACRLFVVPLNNKHIGLKLCFDRGLKCVHVTKLSVERKEDGYMRFLGP